MRRLAWSGLLIIGTGCSHSPATLEMMLESTVKEKGVPAMTAIATRASGSVEIACSGARRFGGGEPVAPSDRFHIGSNAKAMTATLIAMLVDEGKLRWDTKLVDVFSEWKDEIHPDYRQVTISDLLLCTAGTPEYSNFSYLFTDDPTHRDDGSQHVEEDRKAWEDMTSLRGTPKEQRRQFARLVLGRPPAVPPRTRFLYSNAGYGIAGAVVEQVTGEGWESLMQARLFAPLGIRATFDWPASDDPQQPWGHFKSKSGVQPHDPHDSYHLPACLAPGGGISMNAEDYAKFLRLHLQGLQGRDGLLRGKTIQFLHTRPAGADPNLISFAFGWALVAYEGSASSWCEGSAGTFYTGVVILPAKDLAIAVFANAGIKQAGAGGIEVLEWATHHHPEPGQRASK